MVEPTWLPSSNRREVGTEKKGSKTIGLESGSEGRVKKLAQTSRGTQKKEEEYENTSLQMKKIELRAIEMLQR